MKSNAKDFEEALKVAKKARRLIRQLKKERFGSPAAIGLDDQIQHLVQPGYWEHFKSTPKKPMYYRVFEMKPNVNYKETSHMYQVKYAAEYGLMKRRGGHRELLGKDGFLTPIDRKRYKGPRFRYVGQRCPRKNSA
jgi:hypothetical protein